MTEPDNLELFSSSCEVSEEELTNFEKYMLTRLNDRTSRLSFDMNNSLADENRFEHLSTFSNVTHNVYVEDLPQVQRIRDVNSVNTNSVSIDKTIKLNNKLRSPKIKKIELF